MRLERTIRTTIVEKPWTSVLAVSLASLFIGAAVTYAVAGGAAGSTGATGLRLAQKEYPLISPLLMCKLNPVEADEDKSLEKSVNQFISERIRQGKAKKMAVFIVDYKTGKWVGINENDRFDPASMLKVPLMIAYYRAAQSDPKILKEEVSFNGDDQNSDEYFRSDNTIKPGRFYTIEQLIEHMIIDSDNTAALLLQQSMETPALTQVYTDLGLPVPGQAPNVEFLSTKMYAYFFRILYNATYLDRPYSEKALELLSRSEFNGIRSSASGGRVADKFGERTIYDQAGNVTDRELHDCGIVYKQDSPFLLCIMTRGSDFPTLQKNIQDLAALVYEKI